MAAGAVSSHQTWCVSTATPPAPPGSAPRGPGPAPASTPRSGPRRTSGGGVRWPGGRPARTRTGPGPPGLPRCVPSRRAGPSSQADARPADGFGPARARVDTRAHRQAGWAGPVRTRRRRGREQLCGSCSRSVRPGGPPDGRSGARRPPVSVSCAPGSPFRPCRAAGTPALPTCGFVRLPPVAVRPLCELVRVAVRACADRCPACAGGRPHCTRNRSHVCGSDEQHPEHHGTTETPSSRARRHDGNTSTSTSTSDDETARGPTRRGLTGGRER